MDFFESLGVIWLTYKARKIAFIAAIIGYIGFIIYMSFGGGLSGSPFLVWVLFAALNGFTVLVALNIIEYNLDRHQLRK